MLKQVNKQGLFSYVAGAMPVSFLLKLSKTKHIFPYYHLVSDTKVTHTHYLFSHKTINEFKQDLEFITRYFTPISLFDLIDFVKNGKDLPSHSMHLTFDDGYRENYDIIAPILLKRGIPATFFVSTDFIDNRKLGFLNKISIILDHLKDNDIFLKYRKVIGDFFQVKDIDADLKNSLIRNIEYPDRSKLDELATLIELNFDPYLKNVAPFLTSDQLRCLINKGFTIGSHSLDHPRYSLLPGEYQLQQTELSINHLVQKYHLEYRVFAFPHSDEGVGADFFNTVFKSDLIDITFGTGGIRDDLYTNIIQRISMEKPLLGANRLVPLQLARRKYRDFTGKNAEIMRLRIRKSAHAD